MGPQPILNIIRTYKDVAKHKPRYIVTEEIGIQTDQSVVTIDLISDKEIEVIELDD